MKISSLELCVLGANECFAARASPHLRIHQMTWIDITRKRAKRGEWGILRVNEREGRTVQTHSYTYTHSRWNCASSSVICVWGFFVRALRATIFRVSPFSCVCVCVIPVKHNRIQGISENISIYFPSYHHFIITVAAATVATVSTTTRRHMSENACMHIRCERFVVYMKIN